MATDAVACAERINVATLSAWRDDLLPADEMVHIGRHVMACAACHLYLDRFEEVATVLRSQRELEPGDRILEAVRQQAARASRRGRMPRRPRWQSLTLLAPVAALVLLFVYVLHYGPGAHLSVNATPTRSAAPSPTATSTPASGTLRISDPLIARELTFAFVRDNDVWVSVHGQPPQQTTHLGLGSQPLDWRFIWTADGSKVLAVAQSAQLATPSLLQGWLITLPSASVTPLPASALIAEGAPTAWIGDRYLVYVSTWESHSREYNVYDTQTQRTLSTTLASKQATEMEVRGMSVYITDYAASDGPGPSPTPGIVRRYDLASNTVTTAFTVPAMLVAQGLSVGSWDLSADANRIISSSQCFSPPCNAYVQDISGAKATILSSQQSNGFALSISPSGTYAARAIGGNNGVAPAVIQQVLPSGPELTNALPDVRQDVSPTILGWSIQQPGILLKDTDEDAHGNTVAMRIYGVPAGTSEPAHLVETVQGTVVFAPIGS